MPLTDQQAKQIKAQLMQQIAKLPAEQQKQAKDFINSLDNEKLEQFLKQNQIIATKPEAKSKSGQAAKCIFCAIANKEMPSAAIYEDEDYLAALELNPFTKGHTLLIPKKHIKKTKSIPAKAYSIAKRIGKHIVKRLKAESFQITTTAETGHAIINIIPTYKKQPLTYERKQEKPDDLQKLAIKIGEVTKAQRKSKAIKIPKEKAEQAILKLPSRIP